jgi:hypothetical protein
VDLYGSTGRFDVERDHRSIRERHPERDPSTGWVVHRLHPHHRTTRRIEIGTCYLWDHRNELSDLVDVWEAGNGDDLFSVTSLKHFPYVANSDFHKPKHLYSWRTLVRCEKNWPAVKQALRANVDIALTLFRHGSWAAA